MTTNCLDDFDLPDHNGESVRLPAMGTWTLLYWYPKANTPGCVAQAEGIRDNYEAFERAGCTVYGASFDPPGNNRAFRAKYRLPFSLLSDQGGEVARRQGAAGDGDRVAKRVAMLVDPDGTVVTRYAVDDPTLFAEMVLDDLEDAVRNRPR